MPRITFKFLQNFALSKGICVEKTIFAGKVAYEWWRKDNHSAVGVCMKITEAYSEIYYA